MGVIYILTNPSFPEYVKLGYADNLEQRLKELNHSECIPFAFRVYAAYEVNKRLKDLDLHILIDKLNPELRTIDEFDGKQRKREFYAMSAEDAYQILECIAKISGTENKLKRMKPEGHEILDEEEAEIIRNSTRDSYCLKDVGIKVGDTLIFIKDEDVRVKVLENNKLQGDIVEFNGEETTLNKVLKPFSEKGIITKIFNARHYFRPENNNNTIYDLRLLQKNKE